ncbi:hypothetical protein PISMIDRAFT_686370 [Pisolithus microcarpus 441]|uniref:Uncharacterized protein n=1 Tax=Pisolithus microcarpus 441 TaxID=765257 RepID=A0A0C9YRB3_9AGAM|nr:hypothetical protein PISMIDRAFT_686370 [Pisolithus microcarpus 441]
MALVQGCGLAPQLTVLRCCLHHTFCSLTLMRPTDDLGIHGQSSVLHYPQTCSPSEDKQLGT